MTLLRKDYMQGKVTHEDYYSQFVTESTKRLVKSFIGLDQLLASKDPHLNDIRLSWWDRLPIHNTISIGKLKDAEGDTTPPGKFCWSACLNVCIAKAAARMLIKENS